MNVLHPYVHEIEYYALPLAFQEINFVTLDKDYWLNYVKTCYAPRQRED